MKASFRADEQIGHSKLIDNSKTEDAVQYLLLNKVGDNCATKVPS